MWTVNFQMFKLVLQKAEEPGIKLPTSTGSLKKTREFRKTSISALLTIPKPLTVWITINCGKFWKTWEYQTTWPASWETYMQVRKQLIPIDLQNHPGSDLELIFSFLQFDSLCFQDLRPLCWKPSYLVYGPGHSTPGMSQLSFPIWSDVRVNKVIPIRYTHTDFIFHICIHLRLSPWIRKIPWRRKWQPTPVFLPGKSHGLRSLLGYSPWGRKELDMTEQLHIHFH